jgi:hypothetical protein
MYSARLKQKPEYSNLKQAINQVNKYRDLQLHNLENVKKEIELKWNNLFENGFSIILDIIKIKDSEFIIRLKNNGKFRQFFLKDGIKEVCKIISSLKSSKIKSKEYVFLTEIEKHKTHIMEEISVDSMFADKLIYQPLDNFYYFDSTIEKDVFLNILNNKRTTCFLQNLRTNQGGISFYISEKDIFHSPDFIFKCNENVWFAEVTNYTNLSEKIDFIRSKNVPNNYMLIIKDSKNQLLCLQKENFDETKYYELKTWKKLLETYANL